MSLDRYVLRITAVRVLGAAAVLVGVLQVMDLLDITPEIIERGLGWTGIAHYALLRLPRLVAQAAPLAVLAGSIFAFMKLAGDSEVVAMRASGVSAYRLLRMAAPVAVAAMAVNILAIEVAAPRTDPALQSWWRSTAPPAPPVAPKPKAFRVAGDVIVATTSDLDGEHLTDLRIYRRDNLGRLMERIDAPGASYRGGEWTLKSPRFVRFDRGVARTGQAAQMQWPSPLKPVDVQGLFFGDQQMSAAAAERALSGGGAQRPPSYYDTRLHRAVAAPAGVLVMLLLAVPVALASFRSGQGAGFIALSLAGGLLFLVADGFLSALGESGAVSPLVGAWSAPLIFAALAATVLVRIEG